MNHSGQLHGYGTNRRYNKSLINLTSYVAEAKSFRNLFLSRTCTIMHLFLRSIVYGINVPMENA